ncbi:peroxisomal multifunctional beta-oxidation protein [Niveomyces insectorum RCEF 264]|uniref:Peroxisomal multifunctional beta-oxidation protein n=1 Tax=Niveomyces insectorum RCEF 264 TaxID=1081102 RepID=A0A167QZ02_9HYPO|nr:peroxisomal multifunctional beta-oxidation protein [Niveomyces insectorum RCEF 264]
MAGDQLRFDNQVVVVTGAGDGLGKAYALLFAARGAKVVVNDTGGAVSGDGKPSTRAADNVVGVIKAAGGTAVANYDSVEFGDKIIDTAIQTYGRIDVLVNNAGILRELSFAQSTDRDWDDHIRVHVTGSFKCARAAWPHFRKQKYGRVVNTTSGAGIFGAGNLAVYSAAKTAIVGFTETLAKEGAKYNILCNAVSPAAATRMLTTLGTDPATLALVSPDWVAPFVAYLAHASNESETGGIFEVGGAHVSKMRWQRAQGQLLKCDETYTPGAVLKKWDQIGDFSADAQYPSGPNDFMTLLEDSIKMGPNVRGDEVDFSGRVALVTGGGAGIGRAYCLAFARYGAAVVVNDLVNPDDVVNEIRGGGGKAVGVKASAEDGDTVVQAAIDAFGRIDIVINNAGILRDKAFANMDDNMWNAVMNVHARGTFKVTKAAWPHFLKQKYGRVVNTTSTSGIYGNFGQANYSAAKCAILGLSLATAVEGAKDNIYVNVIAPNAGTAMTRTILPEEMVQAFKPDYIAPLVLALCSDKVPKDPTGRLYEVGSGWAGRTRWERSFGVAFPRDRPLTIEAVADKIDDIVDFDNGKADYPTKAADCMSWILGDKNSNNEQKIKAKAEPADDDASDKIDYVRAIAEAKQAKPIPTEFTYAERDVMLYNLGVGAKRTDLKYVFEGAEDFQVLPTYGVIPPFDAQLPYSFDDIVPNFSPMMLLHGEQYLEIKKYPIPTAGSLVSTARLLDVVDKGNAAIVRNGISTVLAATGEELFYNEVTVFLRGCGGFGGAKKITDRGAATAAHSPPADRLQTPDAVVEAVTSPEQAALYRLSGDYNPLHVDPAFAAMGGFAQPILHGLCSFGFAGRAVYETYGAFRNIKVRFAGTVLPGQTLVTEMWRDAAQRNRIVFQTRVKETGKLAIGGAAAELVAGSGEKSKI